MKFCLKKFSGRLLLAFGFVSTSIMSGQLISESFGSGGIDFTEVSGGTWSVSGGRYLLSSPYSSSTNGILGNISVHDTAVSGDFILTALMRISGTISDWNDAAVIFGYQNSNNYYYLSLNESNDSYTKGILKVVNGNAVELANITISVSANTDYSIEIVRSGSNITARVNGNTVASATDATFSGGQVGFGSFNDGAQFDDLLVTTLGGGDTEAPSVPTGLTAGTVTTTAVDLTWNASTDNVGVVGYRIYTTGSNPFTVSGTTATVTGLSEDTTYTFTVTAFDAADNESSPGSGLNVTTDPLEELTSISEDFSASTASFTVIDGGTWSVSGGRYLLSNPAESGINGILGNISVHNTEVEGDFDLSALVRIAGTSSPWNDAAIVFGFQDDDNYYYVSLNENNDGNTKGIFKVVNGTPSELADINVSIVANTDYLVEVARTGASMEVMLNSSLVATASDATFTSGRVGFGSKNDGAQFDDLVVSTPNTFSLLAHVLEYLSLAEERMEITVGELFSSTQYPIHSENNGSDWETVSSGSWVSGFWPGMLWMMYDFTGDTIWKTRATNWNAAIESHKNNTSTHDLGFIFQNSFGKGNEVEANTTYQGILVDAAASLASRYSPTVGAIRSWSWGEWDNNGNFTVILDNMMNLELLLRSAQMSGGDPDWIDYAIDHADTTAQWFMRQDGSVYHIVIFDENTGQFRQFETHQGYDVDSTWARGQAWAIYGFTMMYRETGLERFRDHAEEVAAYYLPNLPSALVPFWDFDYPGIPNTYRDSSAAAVVASALIELSTLVEDSRWAAYYLETAEDIILSLTSSSYFAIESCGSLLGHGTYSFPANLYDTGLIWGDYYLIEALLRYVELAGE